MNHKRVMKRSLSFPQLDWHRPELHSLFFIQTGVDRFHISSESGDWQKVPAMTTGNIMHAAVVASRVVQSDPATEVRHRLRPCPIGVILMPGHAPAVKRRFVEELIVPETNGSFKQLGRRYGEGWVPEQIVKRRRDAPGA